jgi:hypothetical protein
MSTQDERARTARNHPLTLDGGADSSDPGSPATEAARRKAAGPRRIAPQQVVAAALAVAGFAALTIGWIGVANKVEVWEQMPYLISGGFGGAMLLGLGVAVFVAHEHAEDRRQRDLLAVRVTQLENQLTAQLTWRLDELEMAIAAEFDRLATDRDIRTSGSR